MPLGRRHLSIAPLQNLENSLVLKTLPHLLKPDLDLGLLNSQPRMEHVASGMNDLKHEQGSLCLVALDSHESHEGHDKSRCT